MRMKAMKTTNSKKMKNGQIILTLAALLVVSLSCNLPLLSGGVAADEKLAETIQSSGLVFPDEIIINEESVTITYAIYPADSPEQIVEGWLTSLLAAYEAESGVAHYQLITSFDGEPYLEVAASQIDLEGFVSEDLTAEEFLTRLEITDKRPADTRVRDLVAGLGLEVESVSREGTSLVVVYSPDPTMDESALMTEWSEIFAVLSELGGEISEIEIQTLLVDGSQITIVGGVNKIEAYLDGEVTALQFMASLEVVVEEMEAQ